MKEKGIKILFSIFLFASILMPFSVSAESVGGSSPIIGVNITYLGYDGEVVPYQTTVHFDTEQTMWRCTSSHSTMGCQVWESENINGTTLDEITGTITTNATSTYTYRLYQYEFIFDKTYTGSITFNGNHPGATTTTTYYVNGDRLVLTDINLVTSFTIGSYNLTYTPLEVIDKIRQWNFPIESYSAVILPLNYYSSLIKDIYNYGYWTYPMFDFWNNSLICDVWVESQRKYKYCLYTTNNSAVNPLSIISLSNNNFNVSTSIVFQAYIVGSGITYCYMYEFENTTNTTQRLQIRYVQNINNYDALAVPFYSNYSDFKNLSTDFALQFGLRNELLDNLGIITNGTQQSQQAGSDLENTTSDMQSDFNSYYSIENTANSDFNSALNGIDFNDQIAGNQSFLDSASFVKTVFSSMMQIPILSTFVIILCIVLMARIFL